MEIAADTGEIIGSQIDSELGADVLFPDAARACARAWIRCVPLIESESVLLAFVSAYPPTVRPQTPPPRCPTLASPGELTNDAVFVRKAVFTEFTVDISAFNVVPMPAGIAV